MKQDLESIADDIAKARVRLAHPILGKQDRQDIMDEVKRLEEIEIKLRKKISDIPEWPYTAAERDIADHLIQAHNIYVGMVGNEKKHINTEWVDAIHRAQDILNHRILVRNWPDEFR